MNDGLDIRSGGIVAVDTDSLRQAAARWAQAERDLQDAADDLRRAVGRIDALGPAALWGAPAAASLQHTAWQVATCAQRASEVGAGLRELADLYEIVELRARCAAAAASGDAAQLARLQKTLAGRERVHPGLADRARIASGLTPVWVAYGIAGPATTGLLPADLAGFLFADAVLLEYFATLAGRGVVAPDTRTRGRVPPVDLRQTRATTTTAPSGLAAALGRIPQDEARVRVETYTMPDGTAKYAVYIAGTRDLRTDGGDDPADMQSNLEAYNGADSAAYATVRQALADAGVPPGAELYVFGHSQGAMVAGQLTADHDYDVRMLVTAGSPTALAADADTLSLQLRHTDDPVQALAAGGSPQQVGAVGSLVVERVADPMPRPADAAVVAHDLTGYVDTARMVDESQDPRTAAMREHLGELRGAVSVRAVEYDARRRSEEG